MPTDEPHSGTYNLVMPFICCEDGGGPYNASSFVAGCRYAQIDNALRPIRPIGIASYSIYVEPALVPQLDLLAMHLGWTLEAVPWDDSPDEWVLATFEIGNAGVGDHHE